MRLLSIHCTPMASIPKATVALLIPTGYLCASMLISKDDDHLYLNLRDVPTISHLISYIRNHSWCLTEVAISLTLQISTTQESSHGCKYQIVIPSTATSPIHSVYHSMILDPSTHYSNFPPPISYLKTSLQSSHTP